MATVHESPSNSVDKPPSLAPENQGKQELSNSQVFEQLMLAIEQKDLVMVQFLVQKYRPNLNQAGVKSNNQMTPLLFAIKHSELGMVKCLLEHGADVKLAVDNFHAAPHYACCHWRGSPDMLQLLLEHGAPINVSNHLGYTPLHMACMEGNLIMVDRLLRFGASTSVESHRGQTPLTIACSANNRVLVKRLLQANADPWLETRFGCPVAVAMRLGKLDYFQLLIEATGTKFHADQRRMKHGRTIAHEAARLGRLEFLQWAIQSECNVSVRDDRGETPLHVLCGAFVEFPTLNEDRKDEECIRLLVKNGADLSARDGEGNTPMHHAVQRKTSIVELLLELGASPNALNVQGRTPLHLACLSSAGREDVRTSAELVCLLANSGANLDSTDNYGNAPIHYAVKNKVAILEKLLDMGVDPNIGDRNGHTVLHLYCSNPNALTNPALPPTSLRQRTDRSKRTVDENQSNIATMLCARGANPLFKDNRGNLPMFMAAEQSVLESAVFDMVRQCASGGLFETNHFCKRRVKQRTE